MALTMTCEDRDAVASTQHGQQCGTDNNVQRQGHSNMAQITMCNGRDMVAPTTMHDNGDMPASTQH
jgi:hypothetical protein